MRGRSTSPLRRSPLRSPKHRRSPLHSPKNLESPISPPQRKRSQSPYINQSSSRKSRRSLSKEHDSHANGNESRRADVRKLPANHVFETELPERPKQKVLASVSSKVPISLRSPQRDMENRSGDHKKMPAVSQKNSPSNSKSPTNMQKVNSRSTRRSSSLSKSPVKRTGSQMPCHGTPRTREEDEHMTHARNDSSLKRIRNSIRDTGPESPGRREFSQSPSASGHLLHLEMKKKDKRQESDAGLPERHAPQLPNSSKETNYPSETAREEKGSWGQDDRERSTKLLRKDESVDRMEHHEQVVNAEKKHQQGGDEHSELHHGTESIARLEKKMDKKSRLDDKDADTEEADTRRHESVERRRHRKSDKRKRDYDETSESDSQIEDKKEAKRRRKDEKRQRKEEKRRRREERHRQRLERRADKIKTKSIGIVSPVSDFEMDQGGSGDSDGIAGLRKVSCHSDADEAEFEQKKLEIELREKALESLRAKKATSH